MTKEEIALQLTIEFKNALTTANTIEEQAQEIITFYNAIYDGIKTERAVRHGDVQPLK